VLGIITGILVARHLKTTQDLFDNRLSPRTESMVAAAVQWPVVLSTFFLVFSFFFFVFIPLPRLRELLEARRQPPCDQRELNLVCSCPNGTLDPRNTSRVAESSSCRRKTRIFAPKKAVKSEQNSPRATTNMLPGEGRQYAETIDSTGRS
jgi:hypothetical protein